MIRGTGDWLNFLGCVRVQRGDVIFIGSIKCFKVIRPDEIALWSGFLCGKRSIAQVKPSPELVRVFLSWSDLRLKVFTGSGSIWSELKISCRSTSGSVPLARDYPVILQKSWAGTEQGWPNWRTRQLLIENIIWLELRLYFSIVTQRFAKRPSESLK